MTFTKLSAFPTYYIHLFLLKKNLIISFKIYSIHNLISVRFFVKLKSRKHFFYTCNFNI